MIGLLEKLGPEQGCFLSVSGEPGIGKTRLMSELSTAAQARGHLVLGGRGAEFERDIPFGVWIDALDDYLGMLGRNGLERLVGERGARLAEVFPAVAGQFGLSRAGPSGGGPPLPRLDATSLPGERYLVHRTARALLEGLAAERPVLVVIDDLHWTDPASAELLAHLLRHPPAAPVLVAVAFRTGPGPVGVQSELGPAIRDGRGAELSLAPLTADQAGELIGTQPAEVRRALFEQSGGNPFYLRELARAHARDGVPSSVTAALAQELAALPAPARLLAEVAAVAGDPVELSEAAVAAPMGESEATEAVGVLVDTGLLVRADVPRRYRFRHPIVRRAVYETLPEGRRIAAHARLAAITFGRGAELATRAHHVERSAAAGDVGAVQVLIDAARGAASTAPAAAGRWYEAALRLLPVDLEDQRLEILVDLAGTWSGVGRLADARSRLLEAIEMADADALRVRLVTGCAAIERLLGRHDLAESRLQRAIGDLAGEPTADVGALYLEEAAASAYRGEFAEAHRKAAQARGVAERVGDPVISATAASIEAFAWSCSPGGAAADEAIEQAAGAVDGLPTGSGTDALFFLANAELWGERLAQAERHFHQAVSVCRSTGQGQLLVPLRAGWCYTLDMLGELGRAAEQADAAVDAARLTGLAQPLVWALMVQATTTATRGEVSAAMVPAAEAMDLLEGIDQGTVRDASHAFMAVLCAQAGELERSVTHMVAAGAPDFASFAIGRRCFWYATLATVELALGDHRGAEGWARRGEDAAVTAGLPVSGAAVRRARAELMLGAGDSAGAAELALAAAAAADGRHARIEAARSRIIAGRALARLGERDRAHDVLRAAEVELTDCGAFGYREAAAAELRDLGGRSTPADSVPEGPGFSPREREVATLVAEGATNRRVARVLGLSEKTVEGHMHRLFTKLGVRSRAEVAVAITRLRQD